ncbi:guanylate kinase-associated protein mars [Musca vetustissima]|uniref:guanylate kinase-associated protein mars n=1 Tax=Musca vetustissima TaxID=27455 RepID=UPI002AB6BDC8|nr:guanylate kinase-associated protein mars [Musca vetustissima]
MSEYRRSLYKELKQAFTPQKHNRLNRQLQEANRNKQRNEQFQLSRQISVSPTPKKRLLSEKENIHDGNETNNVVEVVANGSRTAKLICTARDPAKIKKQEAFILRFLDWRDKKKSLMEKRKAEAMKKKPFVSAVGKHAGFGHGGGCNAGPMSLAPNNNTSATTNHQASFVPKGYQANFEPPPGLKDPGDIVKDKAKSRQSIYTVVPTPPKKKPETTGKKVVPLAKKVLVTNFSANAVKTKLSNKTPQRTEVGNKNVMNSGGGGIKTKPTTFSSGSSTKPSSTTKPTNNNLIKTSQTNKNGLNSASSSSSSASKFKTQTNTALKPRQLKMPPPSSIPPKKPGQTATSSASGNVVRKSTIPAIKVTTVGAKSRFSNTGARKPTETASRHHLNKKSPQQPQKNARLTQTMKAKKPIKPATTNTTNKLLSLMVSQANEMVSDMVVQTPRDFSNSNHFDEFVTSTKVKNSNSTLDDVDGVSPIEMLSKRTSGHSAAKRNLLKDATTNKMATATSANNHLTEDEEVRPLSNVNPSKRFNFIRYSEVNVSFNDNPSEENKEKEEENHKKEVEDEDKLSPEKVAKEIPNESPKQNLNNTITLEAPSTPAEKTPTKLLTEDKPVNYLSPFVSVSRGKVSLKKEKERRSSIYMVNRIEDELNNSKRLSLQPTSPLGQKIPTEEPKSPQYSAEVMRTLEAVRYFRKQLQDEIDRLHAKCDVWEEYKNGNLEKLQAVNGDDMIDVTIGQTKLLTSKKFMQFKGLIDRCEARATGINDVPDDGSEKTKNVDAVDLEGFWSMLGLQVDNLEKRFENLERWKANDWQDPDEVKPKAKAKPKNLTKVKKAGPAATKARPNSALQQMLRKMQADMRNKKANNLLVNTDDVVLTPSKVRDRKYFSPAATVVAIPASNRRLSILLAENAAEGGCGGGGSSPNRRMSLLGRKNSQDSPRRMSLMNARKNSQDTPNRRVSLMMQKNPIMEFRESNVDDEENSCGTKSNSSVNGKINEENAAAYMSPVVKSRKSILKTPGTARSKLRNVVFNEKLRVKKFNFIVNDEDGNVVDDDQCNKSNEELMDKIGTYSLRNRKVRLRPSCEIVIPK